MRGITDPEFQKVGGMNSCYCTINSFYGGMNLGTGWNEFILGWNEFIILMDAYTETLTDPHWLTQTQGCEAQPNNYPNLHHLYSDFIYLQ